jgi:hypothetical protein
MKTLAAAVLGLAVLVAGLAAAQPPPSQPKHAARTGRSCFWKRDVQNFAAVDDRNVYLRVGVNDVWDLKLFPGCLNLDWIYHLGIRTLGSPNVCEGPTPNVELFPRDTGLGFQRCQVTYVRKLTPAEVAALPKAARP